MRGSPEIQHDQVEVLDVAEEPRLLAVAGGLHRKARRLQRGPEVARDPRIVLDRQRAHQSSSISTSSTAPVAASTVTSRITPSRLISSNS